MDKKNNSIIFASIIFLAVILGLGYYIYTNSQKNTPKTPDNQIENTNDSTPTETTTLEEPTHIKDERKIINVGDREIEVSISYPQNIQKGTMIYLGHHEEKIDSCEEKIKKVSNEIDYVGLCFEFSNEFEPFIDEMLTLVDFILTKDEIEKKIPIVVGHSKGGRYSFLAAENMSRIKGIVTLAAGATKETPELDPTTEGKISDIEVPVYVNHSKDDNLRDVEHALIFQTELEIYEKVHEIYIEETCGHYFDKICWINALRRGVEFVEENEL